MVRSAAVSGEHLFLMRSMMFYVRNMSHVGKMSSHVYRYDGFQHIHIVRLRALVCHFDVRFYGKILRRYEHSFSKPLCTKEGVFLFGR